MRPGPTRTLTASRWTAPLCVYTGQRRLTSKTSDGSGLSEHMVRLVAGFWADGPRTAGASWSCVWIASTLRRGLSLHLSLSMWRCVVHSLTPSTSGVSTGLCADHCHCCCSTANWKLRCAEEVQYPGWCIARTGPGAAMYIA